MKPIWKFINFDTPLPRLEKARDFFLFGCFTGLAYIDIKTFASTVTLANNISLEVVSKMLGHTNTKMTAHYAKLLDKCIGEQMDALNNIYSEEIGNETKTPPIR